MGHGVFLFIGRRNRKSKIGVDGFGDLGDGGVACFGGDDAVYVYGGAGRERVGAC